MKKRNEATDPLNTTGDPDTVESTVDQTGAEEIAERAGDDAVEAIVVEDMNDDEERTPEVVDGNPDAATQLADVQAQLLRTMADFDNFRRRSRQEKDDLQKFATRKLLQDLLPVVDNFDRALSAWGAVDNADATDLKAGIEMVQRQLLSVLQSYGVEAMNDVGQPFDPNVHEAVMQAPADETQAGIVLEEFQKGYRLHDKVLRPAMVKVSV